MVGKKRENPEDHEQRMKIEVDEGMGEFEDRIEDDMDDGEGEVVIHNDSDEDNDEAMEEDEEEQEKPEDLPVYLPGRELEEGEELVADLSTYDMLHSMNVEWPCLSFDILQDKLGNGRTNFPMTCYTVAGSQAPTASENKIYIMKMSMLHKTKFDDDDEFSDDENEDEDPVLEFKTIAHEGGVNRIRAMPHPEVSIIAAMSETGKVNIYDITTHVDSFDIPGLIPPRDTKPIYTITNHGAYEGYGIDWSSVQSGHLLTGDGKGRIFLTTKTDSGFITDKTAYTGHKSSIEDIQWSPSQGAVFATCSADQTIKIWDSRTKNKPQLSVHAHDSDVNVISWNSIWDLRTWPQSKTKTPETAATFNWHKAPITSIDWHPTETSMLAVSGADEQLTIWDLALERDEEEDPLIGIGAGGQQIEVPPQLLFVHQGQKNIKELHWHKQAPGVIISTAYDGFNVFKPFNA
ncbi:ribosome biosynthesis protein rrb1 [Boothiomyces macroporosus]|uniref:Ribosome biosynthesis protein rrb1 n=1 Tax=Boothiomyces macroporosus TaxID=261099 RepID=A0AAD5UD94_9FUNG|nr:ribosome biosynthesis protein rrb1 [Boothiomyces macroporosus]